jgi:hypothetical protein
VKLTKNYFQEVQSMTSFSLILALATPLLATSLLQAQPEGLSALHIEAFTSKGERIGKIYVAAKPVSGGGPSYRGDGRNVILSVPAGNYELTVGSLGFRSTEQLISVYGPSVLRTVLLPVASLHGQIGPALSGQVVGLRGDPTDLRVRLVPLFGGWVEEVHPDSGGRFHFWPEPGPYIVMTVIDSESGTTVADLRQLTIAGNQDIVIDIGKKASEGAGVAPRP